MTADDEEKKVEEVAMEGSNSNEKPGEISIEEDLKRLESLELEVALTGDMYPQLLCLYLASFDFRNAQLLWKRSQSNRKEDGSEFRVMWTIGQRLWQKDYTGAYKILKEKEWSDIMKPYVERLHSAIRERAVEIVERAYSSIKATSFAALMDYSDADALKFAEGKGWTYDNNLKVFVPVRTPHGQGQTASHQGNHMENIRKYVSFLEN